MAIGHVTSITPLIETVPSWSGGAAIDQGLVLTRMRGEVGLDTDDWTGDDNDVEPPDDESRPWRNHI